MTAGRPQKVPRKYVPLWVQVQPAVVAELTALAAELAAQRPVPLNITKQDAARMVLDAWFCKRQEERAARRRPRRRSAAA